MQATQCLVAIWSGQQTYLGVVPTPSPLHGEKFPRRDQIEMEFGRADLGGGQKGNFSNTVMSLSLLIAS
jgi:hypothetical protein